MNMNPSSVLMAIYRCAILLQKNDERLRACIRSGQLIGPYYSTRGQEIIPAALSLSLRKTDYVCTTYRGVHDSVAKGVPLKSLWAELAGKVTGTCKGKGGPMHITHPASGVMVTTGIVGSTMPIANGLALASQIRDEDRVTVASFGDGASNIGAFHESLNLAAIWKLPVIFLCQNNRYAEHTKYANCTSVPQIATRAAAYGIPGVNVDGNDPMAMYEAAKTAVERARAGEGPTLIEAMTFRFHGHLVGDNDAYMDAGEKESWMKQDPVPLLRARLVAEKHATEESLTKLESEIDTALNDALAFALSSPLPDIAEGRRDVFAAEIAQ